MTAAHGTASRYNNGCRCEPCRNAASRRVLNWRNNRDRDQQPASSHGTLNGYMNWGCRCEPCRTARAAYRPPSTPKQIDHGTLSAYTNSACRCDLCKANWNLYVRTRRNRDA